MGIRAYKPTSAGRRFYTVSDFSEITTETPERKLLEIAFLLEAERPFKRIAS